MTSIKSDRVAVVGLGQMGTGIARRLDATGLLCGAWDTNSDAHKTADLSKRVRLAPVEDLVGLADILVFVVPSTKEIELSLSNVSNRSGTVVVDLTTSHPEDSRALANKLALQETAYLDAAMTGGAAGADQGTLTLMVGGSDQDLDRCRPALDAFATQIFHLGPVGSGHTMKLVHNMILHAGFLATCEGLGLAEQAGLDAKQAVEVLNAGNARSFVTEVRFPRDILSGTMNARSRIANLEKDLGLARGFAAGLGTPAPYGELTHDLLARALKEGHGDTDFSRLYPLYRELVTKMDDAS